MGAIVVIASLVLLRLSVLAGGEVPLTEKVLPLLPFLLVAFVRALEPGRWRCSPGRLLLVLFYVSLLFVAATRAVGPVDEFTSQQAAMQISRDLVVVIFGFFVFIRDANERRRQTALRSLCWAPVAFVSTNVILYLAGVHSSHVTPEVHEPDEVLRLVGIHHLRTLFPLAVGVNTFGITIGIAICACVVMAIRGSGTTRKLAIAGGIVSLYAILLTDSRGPLLAALGGALCVLLLGRAVPQRLSKLALFIPISPAIVFGALALLQHARYANTGTGRGSIATGSNRLFIWQPILHLLSNFSPEHLIGYGQYGQITSGASAQYLYLFNELAFVPAAHNFFLQTTLDVGYIGLALVVTIFASSMRMFASDVRQGSVVATVFLAILVQLVLTGFTEAAPTIYSLEAYLFFLLLMTAGTTRSVAYPVGQHAPVAPSVAPRRLPTPAISQS